MESPEALLAFAALAQDTRLTAFRLLVQHEPEGLPAGEVARRLDVPQNTMSAHLATLTRAGLLRQDRRSRTVIYRADLERFRALILFMTEDCCAGRVDLCGPGWPDPSPAAERSPSLDIVIYHNPACGTSRNTLALIRNSGVEPRVVEYLKTPPGRSELLDLMARAGIGPRDLLRRKGTPYEELGLDNPVLTDDQLVDAMLAHPILINRPLVATPLGVKLCRPSELVLDILPDAQQGAFAKEDGEQVVDAAGRRVT
jgi:arsenate reductase